MGNKSKSCVHEILTPVTFDLACPPCAPCARRPEGYPPPLPRIDNCKNDDVLCMFIHLITKTHSNSCRRDCHSNFAEIRVFFLNVSPQKKLGYVWLFFSTFGICSKDPRKPSIANRIPKFDPMPTSITQHAIEALAGQGNVVTKDIDITATIFGVFVCCLMASWLQFRWEWGLGCQMDLRMKNWKWVSRAHNWKVIDDDALWCLMMPYDAFWLCYTLCRLKPYQAVQPIHSHIWREKSNHHWKEFQDLR